MTTRILTALLLLTGSLSAAEWWNPAWTQRQTVTIDAGPDAGNISENLSDATVLVRLHDGNFNFAAAAQGGGDLRFLTADGKTVLPYSIERFDNLINEAFVWVKVPVIKAGEKTTLQLYYGSSDGSGATTATEAFDDATTLFLHFGQSGANFQDATQNANHSENPGTTSDGGIIGSGLRLLDTPLVIPASESLAWNAGQELTLSTWIRPAVLQDNAVIFSKSSETSSLRILLNQGIPLIRITTPEGTQTSTPGAPIAAATWSHLALVAADGSLQLLLNGESYATLAVPLPALSAPTLLGGTVAASSDGLSFFNGELDSLTISNTARSASWLRFAAISQGATDTAQRSLFLGENQAANSANGHSKILEHVMLFGDIARNMMFDGWIAIGVCFIMIVVGWTVAVRKLLYLNSIQKGTEEFLLLWKRLSSDLTAIDHADNDSVRSFGGIADPAKIASVEQSPLYQIYHIGSEEIHHRLDRDKDRTKGLSGRSIQAIRAALDAGLVRANHKLTDGLVYLTISIAGGPYVGLLGTVVGVMITFAIIAKSGEVDVNSIAPGIASALLATVAGLVVAIPALFIYSYLNGRIKNTIAEIKVFIDEFVAKMAEFYPPAGESSPYAPGPPAHNDQAA
ncbi:MAG: DUF2341 domain-containing protein [Luteolibacter sp.]|jgi:biopolymer transport protein ExbB|nr:DUF2341 domain-containing protein [Luteolibacter sp.]